MVEAELGSLTINLLSTGIAAGAGVGASEVRRHLREGRVSVDLGAVANEFNDALKEAIDEENARRETNELAAFTDNWSAIAKELAATSAAPDDASRRDAEEIDVLFEDEADAVNRIAEAYATVEDIPLEEMPEASEAIRDALTRAYRRAVTDFEQRIADTELADRFQAETDLVLADRLADLQKRLAMMEGDVDHLLTQDAYDEGFRQLSTPFFARQSPSPGACWRLGFTLADVEAGIPAEREGLDADPASQDMLTHLRDGENRIVVGRPGSGKSTLCKQVAVRWYESDSLGDVLYRETGTGNQFESTDGLEQAIERGEKPTLVVVEDAVREAANSIAETIEAFVDADGVQFLLDAREQELDDFETVGSMDVRADRRRAATLTNITEYPLPALSVTDVERVREAFTDATGRPVRRDAETLREAVRPETDLGIGEMLLLAFFLPVTDDQQAAEGLEAHVRARYETLDPDKDEALRDLSALDPELLADVGVMVNLLNASEIGIDQELVHALAYEYGHDVETHDEIEAALHALEGWFLFPSGGEGPSWTTHPLWSTLYLRELAKEHVEHQSSSRRRDRSEERVGTCLESLFRLFDDDAHREAVAAEFPGSPILEAIASEPPGQADEYLASVFELGERWPVLAPLFGTTQTARYELPEAASEWRRNWVVTTRGNAHRDRGAYSKARTEYEHRLEQSRSADDRAGIAKSLDDLGLVDQQQGDYEAARQHHEDSLEIQQELGNRPGIASSLDSLGLVARNQGNYEAARQYHENSLELDRELGNRAGIAKSLGNLGSVAQQQGDYEAARQYYQDSLEIQKELGNRTGIAKILNNLGVVARQQGDSEAARQYYQDSLELKEELGNRAGIATSLNNLASVARKQGDYESARQYFEDSLEIREELGNRPGIAKVLIHLGAVARQQGDSEAARQYHESARDHFEQLGAVRRELQTRRTLIELELDVEALGAARTRCEAARARLDEIGRDLPEEREQLEAVCAEIPDE